MDVSFGQWEFFSVAPERATRILGNVVAPDGSSELGCCRSMTRRPVPSWMRQAPWHGLSDLLSHLHLSGFVDASKGTHYSQVPDPLALSFLYITINWHLF